MALIKRQYDLRCKNSAGLFNTGINTAKVTKYIAAAADEFKIIVHRKASFNRFRRSRIRSISI